MTIEKARASAPDVWVRDPDRLRDLEERCARLEAERTRLKAIVQGSRDAIWAWTTDGTIILWNVAAERLLGYTADEIIGHPLLKLVRPERWPAAREIMASVKKGAGYDRHETVRVRKDGSLVDVELTASPILDSGGAVVGASTICREITEGKQFEASLAKRVSELTCLFHLTERLQRAETLDEAFAAGLEAIEGALGCSRASILLFDAGGVMRFVAWRGLSEGYRKAVDGHSPWARDVRDPAPILVADIEAAAEPEPLKAVIRAEGIRGLAFIPLVVDGALIGKFMTYYPEPHAFAEEETRLAAIIARQLALAVGHQLAAQELRQSEERFRLMSEQAPVMIWMSDPERKEVRLNHMLREFFGLREADIAGVDWQTKMHPDDAPVITSIMDEAFERQRPVVVKGRFRNASGAYRVLQTSARPRFSARGDFLGMIGVNVDVTEREEAESALKESEERFRLAVEAAPSGMAMTDADGRIVMINAQLEQLFGYRRNELVGQKIELLVPDESKSRHPGLRRDYYSEPAARAMGLGRDLRALRKDGREFPVEIGLSPFQTSQGLMTLAAVVDISSRKRAEAERELLIAELNHRVKNTLSIVQGIAHQTFRDDDPTQDARKAFEGRLVALALAHNLLTEANWGPASLQEIARVVLNVGGESAGRVKLSGPAILLLPKDALSIAMALHELCTNAMKYGALSNDSGRVSVEWRRAAGLEPRLELIWRESDGPPVAPPQRRGFGSRLLERALAYDLMGEVSVAYDPAGVVCRITAPLPKIADSLP